MPDDVEDVQRHILSNGFGARDLDFFSMPVPKIIDKLDLWEHVGGWMATICGRPASVHPVEEAEGMQDNCEAGALLYIEVLVLFFIVCFQG